MNKPAMKMLERAFEAEVAAALSKMTELIQPKNTKLADELVDQGYLAKGEHVIQGKPPVTIRGYRLTELGRMTYCISC